MLKTCLSHKGFMKQMCHADTGGEWPRARTAAQERGKETCQADTGTEEQSGAWPPPDFQVKTATVKEGAEDDGKDKKPICTAWRMPKEKEPTGPIKYIETTDIVSPYEELYICEAGRNESKDEPAILGKGQAAMQHSAIPSTVRLTPNH